MPCFVRAIGDLIACGYHALNGFKTLIVAAVVLLLGLAEYVDITSITPVLQLYFGEKSAATVAILLPIIFGLLRWATSGPLGRQKPHSDEEPF